MADSTRHEQDIFQFAGCELSKVERLLLRNGQIVQLQSRPFDLLLYLIENRDRVVSRDELLRAVWKGVCVNEQAMRFAVHAVRRAIGDSGQTQNLVRTVRGNGLQFIAPVETRSCAGDVFRADRSFLGREHFIHCIERALAEIASGRLRTIFASGEAGIGKTTALLRAASIAASRGLRVGSARCFGTDEAPAMWPWTQVLRRLIEDEERSSLASVVRDGSEEIVWLLPELRGVISRAISPTTDSRAARYRLFDSVAQFLSRLAVSRPVALFLDDLHEADRGSLDLFEYLVAELSYAPLFLFGTFREPGLLYRKCSSMVSSVIRLNGAELVRLSSFSEREVAILAEARSGSPPSATAVRELLAKTSGNPFFVLQILKVLENDGRLDSLVCEQSLEYSIPRGVREAITRQFDALPAEVRDLLGLAAEMEKEFSSALLERALELDSTSCLKRLETAVDAGICVRDDQRVNYRFAHALVREGICASLTTEERAKNNGRIGSALQEATGNEPGPLSADTARHFAAAYPDPIAERAIAFSLLAARWDIERAAFDSAATQTDRALALLERLCPSDVQMRCEICLERGWAHGLAGNRDESQRALGECASLAERCNRSDLMARASLLFAPDLLAIETGVFDQELVRLLEAALRLLPKGAKERPRILARLGVALHWSDEPRERIKSLVEEAVDGLDLRQERETRAFVRTAGRLALYSVECPTDSIRESVAGDAEDDSTSLLRTILRITALWQVGRMRDVEVEIENFSSLWERVKRPSAAWYVRMLRATMALMKGQYELSSELAQQYLRQGLAVDDRNAIHSFALQRAMWAIDVGNMKELEPAVIDMATRFPRVEGWLAGVCYLYTELGKMAEARDAMDRAIGQGVLNSYPRNSWFGTLCSLTLACRVIESPAVVDQLYSLLERFAGQMAVVGFSSFCWGSTDRFLGILAGLMRKWNVSDAHFRRAIAINRAAGAWPALAHTYADLGSMLNRRLPGSGQEASNLALEQTRSMGMVNLERRILQNL